MNTSRLSRYAPEARKAFIDAVSTQAARLGITATGTAGADLQGDVLLVSGQAFPKSIAPARKKLVERVHTHGFEQTMEAMAYTWFNRLVAIRYMELHAYLDHGYRVLSHPEGHPTPEIVEHAEDLNLPGLNTGEVVDLKLDGTKESELYHKLLIAQCNALHQAMPFLFESVDNESELLLPDNLLHSDSLIRKLVQEIPEEDWQDIEIIGWLYQFYISEKKDQVIGKVVASEDIPAATQLFTPNWIVKYMVQNSLGAQWLATYPDSPLKEQMEYYIEPAEQTDGVKAQLEAITPSQLNPEELTLIDPASGSGHILVEAYELFKAIYLERGYSRRDVPKLILEKNLFGLDIDERAAQLTGFALMMKGRADDRRLFERGVKLNVMALVESAGFDAEGLAKGAELGDCGLKPGDLTELKRLFEHATTFGSLIQVPEGLAEKLPALKQLSEATSQDLFVSEALNRLGPLVQQAELLAAQYDAVVANPPYCGSRYMNKEVSELAKHFYPDASGDMFSMFIVRTIQLLVPNGRFGVVCPFVWMFISNYQRFRRLLLQSLTFESMIRLEYNAFEPACVPVSTWVATVNRVQDRQTTFIDLSPFKGFESQPAKTLEALRQPDVYWRYSADCNEFLMLPSASFAYLVSSKFRRSFTSDIKLADLVEFTGSQNKTGDNERFVRLWWESAINESASKRWVLYAKGGGNRKWWGFLNSVVDWSDDARNFYRENKTSNLLDKTYWFREGVTYSMLTSNQSTFRVLPPGGVYDMGGPAFHPTNVDDSFLLVSLCNSTFAERALKVLNPTLNLQSKDVKSLPVPELLPSKKRSDNKSDQ